MTRIDRYSAQAGTHHFQRKLILAKEQLQLSFPDDERREILQVLAVFTALDKVIAEAQALSKIFSGNGSHTVADFMPDETGTSANDRAMAERDANRGLY